MRKEGQTFDERCITLIGVDGRHSSLIYQGKGIFKVIGILPHWYEFQVSHYNLMKMARMVEAQVQGGE